MPRKRKSDQITQTETPAATIEVPVSETATAVADPPADPKPESGFAERVGQKQWPTAPDPFGIAKDNVAGVRLFESKEDRQVAIKFGDGRPEDKPSQAVIDKMKEAGFRWDPRDRIWTHPVRGDSPPELEIPEKRTPKAQVRSLTLAL